LDEADRSLPVNWSSIIKWLKLTQGSSITWGFDFGRLLDQTQIASNGSPDFVSEELVSTLIKTAPPALSPETLADLKDLHERLVQKTTTNIYLFDLNAKLQKKYSIQPF
jgi:hypothetical protein